MASFQAQDPRGDAVAQLEVLVRTAVFKSANALVGWLLQQAADRVDAAYPPKPDQRREGRKTLEVQGIFGRFPLQRDYFYHPGKQEGHYPADAALGLEIGYTPALAKLMCLEEADVPTYLKAERHLEKTGGISVSARQVQRVIQRVGQSAQACQEREVQPGPCDTPILYVSADGTGVPMVPEELKAGAANRPMARPRPVRFTWAACSPSTTPMKRAILCGTMNRAGQPLCIGLRCHELRPSTACVCSRI